MYKRTTVGGRKWVDVEIFNILYGFFFLSESMGEEVITAADICGLGLQANDWVDFICWGIFLSQRGFGNETERGVSPLSYSVERNQWCVERIPLTEPILAWCFSVYQKLGAEAADYDNPLWNSFRARALKVRLAIPYKTSRPNLNSDLDKLPFHDCGNNFTPYTLRFKEPISKGEGKPSWAFPNMGIWNCVCS